QNGEFIGFYKTSKLVNGSTVGVFENDNQEEYLIGGAQIKRLIVNNSFKTGIKYLIKFIGKGNYKGRKINNFKVYELDEDDAES
ncbi:MAG: hypothetical protein QXJ93_01085, partial [Candidatus Rehaiarchaeum fermentans]|nr:hypothetical protein [Candidatus Rehaiarchaeum fermentans]